MKFNQFRYVDIRNAISVSEAEHLFIFYEGQYPPQSSAGHRFGAGIDQSDTPRFDSAPVALCRAFFQIEGHIGGIEKVVGEKFLDHIALVPKTNDEVIDSKGGANFHDVPQDGFSAN